jgi:CxxC-x17-CxxC domain-containing protein
LNNMEDSCRENVSDGLTTKQEIRKMRYDSRGGGDRRFDRRPREMHKITCSDCGAEAEVPFKPTEGKPVYCRECYQKHRPPRRDRF